MPRSIQGFKPKALSQDHRFYSDDDIEAIIAAAGGTVRGRVPRRRRWPALSERLEVVAHNYTQCSQFQTEPTAKQIADAMADIEAAASKLIAALHVPEAMDEDSIASMPASLRYGALQAQAALEAGTGLPSGRARGCCVTACMEFTVCIGGPKWRETEGARGTWMSRRTS